MADAVIVSTARTGIGKAFKGSLNLTHGAEMGGHVIKHAVERAGIDPAEVEEIIMGCGLPEGATGNNIARLAGIRGGIPVTSTGATIARFCGSGLSAVAHAAQRCIVDKVPVAVGGGLESISLVQNNMNMKHAMDKGLLKLKPTIMVPMIPTAENVAKRFNVTREEADQLALLSQQRTAEAQRSGKLGEEIVPITVTMEVTDKETGKTEKVEVTLSQDEGNRVDTTLEKLASLKPVSGPTGTVTAGNASQLSDGAAAVVIMNSEYAEKKGVKPLGIFRGFATAGCEPDIMGIGPVFAIPRLLERHGLKMDDIGLWELNEAFGVQAMYCIKELGIPMELCNVNGGAIALGHPIGASGARVLVTLLYELRRSGTSKGLATLCIGGGMGIAMCVEAMGRESLPLV